MIDEQVFKKGWVLLCDRFNREPSQPVMVAYYRSLSAQMSTEEYELACQVVFEEREFFPRPVDFLNAGRPDPRAEALEQWELAMRLIAGDQVELSEEGRRVVRLMGGARQLGHANLDTMPFIRKEFLQLYGETAAIARREERPRLEAGPEARQLAAGVQLKALK